MDDVDKEIIALLRQNARMTIKEIAAKVMLTSPAVSERIRRLEKNGVISGYTVKLNPVLSGETIHAIISIYVPKNMLQGFQEVLDHPAVEYCYLVTGEYSHILKVNCSGTEELELVLRQMQDLGKTNTQVILATAYENQTRNIC